MISVRTCVFSVKEAESFGKLGYFVWGEALSLDDICRWIRRHSV